MQEISEKEKQELQKKIDGLEEFWLRNSFASFMLGYCPEGVKSFFESHKDFWEEQ